MTTRWARIEADEAKQHPLYGIGGWLIVFAVSILLGLLRTMGEFISLAIRYDASVGELLDVDVPAMNLLKFGLCVNALIVAVIYALLALKHRAFRGASSALLVCGWPLIASVGMLDQFPGLVDALGLSFLSWALSCAVWVTYLQRSERVRVTFESSVRSGDRSVEVQRPQGEPASFPVVTTGERQSIPEAERPDEMQVSDQSVTGSTLSPEVEEEFWARALAEFDSPDRRPGLWAKAYSESLGDEAVAMAKYLGARVGELKKAHREQAGLNAEAEKQQHRLETLAKLEAEKSAIASAPMGRCPNSRCGAVMPMVCKECPECSAYFSSPDWCLTPVT